MWNILKPIFFLLSAETAHYLSMYLLSAALRLPIVSRFLRKSFSISRQPQVIEAAGMVFRNRLGLAAGFDKDGRWLNALSQLGFGHIEVGTVTPKAQAGNAKPRLFRLPDDRSIINRMGFNNCGADALAARLRDFKKPFGLIIGGNIGKNKSTPAENAADDYIYCFRALFDCVDYFAINVSSPNTPGLRALQEKAMLDQLLRQIQQINQATGRPKPVLLKVAPDLSNAEIVDISEVIVKNKLAGIIIGNTTVERPDKLLSKNKFEEGGLSGAALTQKADEVLRLFRQHLTAGYILIGVGGIMDEDDAQQRIDHGADLIQIYTGMIYGGPWLIRRILERIR